MNEVNLLANGINSMLIRFVNRVKWWDKKYVVIDFELSRIVDLLVKEMQKKKKKGMIAMN